MVVVEGLVEEVSLAISTALVTAVILYIIIGYKKGRRRNCSQAD